MPTIHSKNALSRHVLALGVLLAGFIGSGAMHCSGPCPDIGPVVVESYGSHELSQVVGETWYLVTLEEPREVTVAFQGGYEFRLTTCSEDEEQGLEEPLEIEGVTPFEAKLPPADCYKLEIDFDGMGREASLTVRTVLDEPIPGGMSQGAHGQYCPPPRVWFISTQTKDELGLDSEFD